MSLLQTVWLTVTNVLLGVAVAVFVAGTLGALVREVLDAHKRRMIERHLDGEMRSFFGGARK